MFTIINCTNCDCTGPLPIEFKFTEPEICKKCHNVEEHVLNHSHFCSFKCFVNWFEKYKIKGVPCRACNETGYAFSFKENGKCKTCKGKKFVNGNNEKKINFK